MINISEWYSTNLVRRQRLLDVCLTLPKSILEKRFEVSLIANHTIISSSILDLWNEIFQKEDYWLRQVLERESSVFPSNGFNTLKEIQKAFITHQGELLTLCGLGPEGGWDARFELPNYSDVLYRGETIFWSWMLDESRLRGKICQILEINGIESPPQEFI